MVFIYQLVLVWLIRNILKIETKTHRCNQIPNFGLKTINIHVHRLVMITSQINSMQSCAATLSYLRSLSI